MQGMLTMQQLAAAVSAGEIDTDAVRGTGRHPLFGGGAQIGEIRAALRR